LPVCHKTNQVLEVEVLKVNVDSNSIIYVDDGNEVETSILDGNCKLQWKVDWAMRWIALGIDYEMYGKDLIPTFQLSAKICRALGGNPPENYFYELFLDQNGEKISKSKGNGLSIEEWLSFAPQETLSYFMYQNPRRAKKLFLEIIPKSTDEFLSHLNKFDEQSLEQKIDNPLWHISNGASYLGKMPISYNLILNLVSASGSNDPNLILDFIKKYAGNIEEDSLVFTLKLIDGVINYYNNVTKSLLSFKIPNSEEIIIFEDLVNRLSKMTDDLSAEEIQTEIYQIGKDHNFTNLRDWFTLIYQVLFGKSEGPRFGSFVAIYGIEKTIQLIEDKVNSGN
jgi:lysyl-tRNA synthetase class 1